MHGKLNIVFIGDSLTEFFDWQRRFPAYKIFNLGIPGETVEGLLQRIDRLPPIIGTTGRGPDAIFVMTGINNIAMEDYDIIGRYKQAITAINNSFSESRLIVQSILPVRLPWVDNIIIQGLNKKLNDMAKEFKAEYLDLFSLFLDPDSSPIKDYLLDDGVHLSNKGYEVWSGALEEWIKLAIEPSESADCF